MASVVIEKCVGRFDVLKDYFSGIHVEDLPKFPPSYFENLAKDQHKPLMYLFMQQLRSEIQPLEVHRPIDISCKWCNLGTPFLCIDLHGGKVASCMYEPSLSRVSTPDCNVILRHRLTTFLRSISSKPVDLALLDLSFNDLLDADMPFIVDIISVVVAACRGCRVAVSLNHNGLYYPDNTIRLLLRLPEVCFLDVQFNAFASNGRRDFFSELQSVELEHVSKKLIFIPKNWLPKEVESEPAKRLFPAEVNAGQALTTHQSYYSIFVEQ